MADVHMTIKETNKLFLKIERRNNFTTPKSFLEFKNFYNKLLKEKRIFIDNKIKRLETGLEIIRETNSKVIEIKKEVAEVAI